MDRYSVYSTYTRDRFWTVYLLGAYQYHTGSDCDGLDAAKAYYEGCTAGVADGYNVGSVLFMESSNELKRPGVHQSNFVGDHPAGVVVHEVAHLFGADHIDGGIMKSEKATLDFTSDSLIKIRSTIKQ